MKVTEAELEKMEEVVFASIPPGEVHLILSEWSGTNYFLLIEALFLHLNIKEVKKAARVGVNTADEMILIRACGTYTLQ